MLRASPDQQLLQLALHLGRLLRRVGVALGQRRPHRRKRLRVPGLQRRLARRLPGLQRRLAGGLPGSADGGLGLGPAVAGARLDGGVQLGRLGAGKSEALVHGRLAAGQPQRLRRLGALQASGSGARARGSVAGLERGPAHAANRRPICQNDWTQRPGAGCRTRRACSGGPSCGKARAERGQAAHLRSILPGLAQRRPDAGGSLAGGLLRPAGQPGGLQLGKGGLGGLRLSAHLQSGRSARAQHSAQGGWQAVAAWTARWVGAPPAGDPAGSRVRPQAWILGGGAEWSQGRGSSAHPPYAEPSPAPTRPSGPPAALPGPPGCPPPRPPLRPPRQRLPSGSPRTWRACWRSCPPRCGPPPPPPGPPAGGRQRERELDELPALPCSLQPSWRRPAAKCTHMAPTPEPGSLPWAAHLGGLLQRRRLALCLCQLVGRLGEPLGGVRQLALRCSEAVLCCLRRSLPMQPGDQQCEHDRMHPRWRDARRHCHTRLACPHRHAQKLHVSCTPAPAAAPINLDHLSADVAGAPLTALHARRTLCTPQHPPAA